MEYDITKPLGEHLEEYMGSVLKNICYELAVHGIVYENQFDKLYSMVCKLNATQLCDLFTKRIKRKIWHAYDDETMNFVFYDMDVYRSDEALRLSVAYQTRKCKG